MWNLHDGDVLSGVEFDAVQLGHPDRSHRLVQRRTVHIDRGSQGKHETGDPGVHSVIFFRASDCGRKSRCTGEKVGASAINPVGGGGQAHSFKLRRGGVEARRL